MFDDPVVTPLAADIRCSSLMFCRKTRQECYENAVALSDPSSSMHTYSMQIDVRHRSKELWTAGVPYQSYVEQAEIILLQNLLTPPFTVVLGPTTSYRHGACITRTILFVEREHNLLHVLLKLRLCKSCSTRC